ncbi:MAG: c-type cytochrome [Anaerolineales bacterium]|nr:c-type cytochrome [Anaerolineales bacterium]
MHAQRQGTDPIPDRVSSWSKAFSILLILILLSGCTAAPTTTSAPSPMPTYTPDSYEGRLLSQGYVLLSANTGEIFDESAMSQIELGAEKYRQVCMACHGDWGQGLTPEWRAQWGDDGNCWQSHCHASNHPASGFELPKVVPALSKSSDMARITNAAELQEVILQTMPWWNPGFINEEESWAITAFLMEKRAELGPDVTLTTSNAPVFRLHVMYAQPENVHPTVFGLLTLLLLATAVLIKPHHG